MPLISYDVQKNTKVPKYRVIKEFIISSIASGSFAADEQLPTEYALMDQYGTSRVTVRRALKELQEEGYIYTIQGKGTFCSNNDGILAKNQRTDLRSSGYRMIVERHKKKYSRSFVMLATKECSPKDAETLNIEPGTQVMVLERIHSVDGKPWVFVRGFMHPEHARGFEAYNPANVSLFDIARNNFGGILESREKHISVVGADKYLAMHLDVEIGFPLVMCDYVACLLKNSEAYSFESAHAFYRTDVLSYLPEYT